MDIIYSKKNPRRITGFAMTKEEFESYRDDSIGLCLACGAERDMCEPDAEAYDCEDCEKSFVFGMDTLLILGRIKII